MSAYSEGSPLYQKDLSTASRRRLSHSWLASDTGVDRIRAGAYKTASSQSASLRRVSRCAGSWRSSRSSASCFFPLLAFAQATITGVVRDASGAVLPGVVVEAASDALIEKVRSAVTDGTGQFRIIDLRPGTYSVTFTLTGFQTIKREGVELEGQLTATVNADMRVGSLEETITVTGETPIVDVQSVRRQATISGDVITAIPSARAYGAIMQLIPSLTVQASFTPGARDVQVTPAMSVFGGAGRP